MMWSALERGYVLLAVALTVLVLLPVAIAEADGPGASTSASLKKANKRIKGLNKRLLALEATLQRALGAQGGAGGAGVAGDSAKPNGPAGGDLSGTYPNPLIAPNAVGVAEIAPGAVGVDELADNAVTAAEIFDDTITSFDIGASAVGASELLNGSVGSVELAQASVRSEELGGVVIEIGAGVLIPDGGADVATVTCPPGTRLLSGGFEWLKDGTNTTIISSSPTFDGDPATTWQVAGQVALNPNQQLDNTLFAEALCLQA